MEDDTYLAKHCFSREELFQLVHQAEDEGRVRPNRRHLENSVKMRFDTLLPFLAALPRKRMPRKCRIWFGL